MSSRAIARGLLLCIGRLSGWDNEAERIAELWRPPGLESRSPGGFFSEKKPKVIEGFGEAEQDECL